VVPRPKHKGALRIYFAVSGDSRGDFGRGRFAAPRLLALNLEIFCRGFSLVRDFLVFDNLPFIETGEAGSLDSRDMDKHIFSAGLRLNKAVPLLGIEPLHRALSYISLECSPYLANDTEATMAEALRLWAAVKRPNLMVKVPATPAGIPAIRELIGRGLNINITLLFSVSVYEQVVEAYISGLEDLERAGDDVSKIGSVASIFVSRIDTAIDKQLDKLGDKQVVDRLRGKAAIANAKLAYVRYKALFSGPRWQLLASSGAKTQRLLWASTSTKNPAYKDTMYVEALIGRDTVNTVPPATMDAFRDHGEANSDVMEQDVEGARAMLAELEQHGVSLNEVTEELVKDGVQQFADAFDKLFGTSWRSASAMGCSNRFGIATGSITCTAGSSRAGLFFWGDRPFRPISGRKSGRTLDGGN